VNRLTYLFVEELRDLYHAERQLLKALPTMAAASTAGTLRDHLEESFLQTTEHVSRLKRIFKTLGESPKGKKCKGMKGLIKAAAEVIEPGHAPQELDARLVAAAQRIEHYELAAYGCVSAYAALLGDDTVVALLKMTLAEGNTTIAKLAELSGGIYMTAATSNDTAQGPRPVGDVNLAATR
jgi:ferritin-like metal-binding protein YciE